MLEARPDVMRRLQQTDGEGFHFRVWMPLSSCARASNYEPKRSRDHQEVRAQLSLDEWAKADIWPKDLVAQAFAALPFSNGSTAFLHVLSLCSLPQSETYFETYIVIGACWSRDRSSHRARGFVQSGFTGADNLDFSQDGTKFAEQRSLHSTVALAGRSRGG